MIRQAGDRPREARHLPIDRQAMLRDSGPLKRRRLCAAVQNPSGRRCERLAEASVFKQLLLDVIDGNDSGHPELEGFAR